MHKQSHIERTAHEPRDPSLHTVTIADITQITPTIRLFRLEIPPSETIRFLPGQWLDLHPPPSAHIPKPGGFTITSPPSLALPPSSLSSSKDNSGASPYPYLELAIQSSPLNPAAAYLFLPAPQLLRTSVRVRVGGSFVFPPPSLVDREGLRQGLGSGSGSSGDGDGGIAAAGALKKVVFVAGGMGINPLMSMLSFIEEQGGGGGVHGSSSDSGGVQDGFEVRVLYSVQDPGFAGDGGGGGMRDGKTILFLDRIVDLFGSGRVQGTLRLFLTERGPGSAGQRGVDGALVRCSGGVDVPFQRRRLTVRDVEEAIGGDKEAAAVYVCGVPSMTDEFVEALVSPEGLGMEKRRIMFEKWW